MLKIIRDLLQQKIDDIDTGNSYISENQQEEVIEFLCKISSNKLNITEAADYIGKSKSTFNNYVKKGLIPKGEKDRGDSKFFWRKLDLDKFLQK